MSGQLHVVIVGGGFGGLNATRALRRAPVRITLIDSQNFHLFQPLLYQVATAALDPSAIASPLRRIFRRQPNVEVILGEAMAIDPAGKRVILADGAIPYDVLVLATGATHNYFGHEDRARWAPGLKRIEDALEIRRRVLRAFEAAEREEDPARRAEWLTFVVVGGGPTGVELAGALADIARRTMTGDFRRFDPAAARVILLEAGPRILPAYPPELSEKARLQLEGLGAEVRVDSPVAEVDGTGVHAAGSRLPARTVLWAAGVKASPLARSLGAPLDRSGRVKVDRDLTVPGHPDIFVVGDLADIESDGKPVPGLAPAAIQLGRHAGRNIRRLARGRPPLPFRYRDKGMLATIGRAAAVADLPWAKISGRPAWWLRVIVHIYFLIGFRNRFMVLLQWAWQRFAGRGVRLITGEPHPLELAGPAERPGPESGPVHLPRAEPEEARRP